MKIRCQKFDLIKAINIVSRAVVSKTTNDMFRCIMLRADADEIILTVNNTEMGIETRIKGYVEYPGMFAIDAGNFSSIIRKMPDEEIIIEQNENYNVKISSVLASFKISGRGNEGFVFLPEYERISSVNITQFIFRDMINKVIFAADPESSGAMSGVYIEVFDDNFRMSALDGHRIALRRAKLKKEYEKASSIVPCKTLSEISKIMNGDMESYVDIIFSKNHIIFEYDDTVVVSRIIEGEYFRVASLINTDIETKFNIDRKQFFDCIDRSTLLTGEGSKKPVIFTIGDENINIKIKSALGSFNENIYINKEGNDIKIAFNPLFLIDALKSIEDSTINVYMRKYNNPCIIKDDEENYNYVILPVNFTEE